MNFQNLPGQLLVLLFGWMFTLYLQHNSNRRTEALKRKDKIVDRLGDLAGWVDDEVTKSNFKPTLSETAYTGLLLELELRIKQFNGHVGSEIISLTSLGKLRGIDFFDEIGREELTYQVRELASEIVEEIELGCNELYFNNSLLYRVKFFMQDLKGIVVGLLALILFVVLVGVIDRTFFHR
ncbi:hypothetical protein [Pseudomonas sp. UBA4617]|uniref:hypothetical protein n=1 Tax=Pseudomonas sp. UBA4617 TaxID=1947318 RepID=UPI0025FDCAF4|nr:hypothetical protein [Pseudomonas sp. UBA4617]